jgi:hypothetical protein
MPARTMTLLQRFKSKLSESNKNGCIEWKGAIRRTYGVIRICDKNLKYKYNSSQSAHIISYELFIGNIPEKMLVLHKCDNRLCVNPKHLFLGTHKDNALDMINKDRGNMKRGKIFEHHPFNNKVTK